nr:MAG TPA: hypothetical protein [Caudoviricetes sp.]
MRIFAWGTLLGLKSVFFKLLRGSRPKRKTIRSVDTAQSYVHLSMEGEVCTHNRNQPFRDSRCRSRNYLF